MLMQGFNQESGATQDQDYIQALLNDPNGKNLDMLSNIMGDRSNEAVLAEYAETARSLAGGRGGDAQVLAQDADEAVERFSGSREFNISAFERIEDKIEAIVDLNHGEIDDWSVDDALILAVPNDENTAPMPEISYILEQDDPQMAIMAIAADLAARGVDMDDIDRAMTAGNDFDVLNELVQIADDNDLDDVANFGKNIQQGFADMGVAQAMVYAAPEVQVPEFKIDEPIFKPEEQRPVFGAMAMG